MAALKPWYLQRLRASHKLKGNVCPGEEVCCTDMRRGVIARDAGKNFDNYCHPFETPETDTEREELSSSIKRIYPGCQLYPTKPETLPADIASAVDTAEDLKEERKLGFLGWESLKELTAWEVACYRVADRCADEVEAEDRKDQPTHPAPQIAAPAVGQSTAPTEGMNW